MLLRWEYLHELAEHHGEGVWPCAGRVVEEVVPHALDGALLGLDDVGEDGAQPLDEAADLRARELDDKLVVVDVGCEGVDALIARTLGLPPAHLRGYMYM